MISTKVTKRILLILLLLIAICVAPSARAKAACVAPDTSRGQVSMNVNVPADGLYRVWSRMIAPNTTDNSYNLIIDANCAVVIGDGSAIPANNWAWVNYQNGNTASYVDVNLTSGVHTISLIGREDSVGVDRLILTTDMTCIPTGTGDNCATIVTSTPDTLPPVVSITAPADNTNLAGTVPVSADATDNVGVTKVEFYVDGALQNTSTSKPYGFSLDTSKLSSGTGHSLVAKAYDAANNVGQSATVTFTVGDTQAPTVRITNPINGTRVSKNVTITASASDNGTIGHMEIILDGKQVAANIGVNTISYSWNVRKAARGQHIIVVNAYDSANNNGTATIMVTK